MYYTPPTTTVKDETKDKKKKAIEDSMNESENEDIKKSDSILEKDTLQIDSSLVVTIYRLHMWV